ncbi:MAG: signal peptidase II [bacterium]
MQNRSHDTASPADEKWKRRSARNSGSRHALFVFTAVLAAVVCLDAVTKLWASVSLRESPIQVFPGFFVLDYVENTGVAFGLFQGHSGVLMILSPLAFLFLAACLGWHTWDRGRRSTAIACGMIVGGALGNVWSRLAHGYVIDFLDFLLYFPYIGSYDWPAFNLADSALCCGVVLFLFVSRSSACASTLPADDHETSPD